LRRAAASFATALLAASAFLPDAFLAAATFFADADDLGTASGGAGVAGSGVSATLARPTSGGGGGGPPPNRDGSAATAAMPAAATAATRIRRSHRIMAALMGC